MQGHVRKAETLLNVRVAGAKVPPGALSLSQLELVRAIVRGLAKYIRGEVNFAPGPPGSFTFDLVSDAPHSVDRIFDDLEAGTPGPDLYSAIGEQFVPGGSAGVDVIEFHGGGRHVTIDKAKRDLIRQNYRPTITGTSEEFGQVIGVWGTNPVIVELDIPGQGAVTFSTPREIATKLAARMFGRDVHVFTREKLDHHGTVHDRAITAFDEKWDERPFTDVWPKVGAEWADYGEDSSAA